MIRARTRRHVAQEPAVRPQRAGTPSPCTTEKTIAPHLALLVQALGSCSTVARSLGVQTEPLPDDFFDDERAEELGTNRSWRARSSEHRPGTPGLKNRSPVHAPPPTPSAREPGVQAAATRACASLSCRPRLPNLPGHAAPAAGIHWQPGRLPLGNTSEWAPAHRQP